jgi:hypothetical protein
VNVTLSMMVQNEEDMLRKTLPATAPQFSGRFAVLHESGDGTEELLGRWGFRVKKARWPGDFSEAFNRLVSQSRKHSPNEWQLLLDADEALAPGAAQVLARELESAGPEVTVAVLRFAHMASEDQDSLDDALKHKRLRWHPDWSSYCIRAIRSTAKVEFRDPVHQVLCRVSDGRPMHWVADEQIVSSVTIYHYGACRPAAERKLKLERYRRMSGSTMSFDDEWKTWVDGSVPFDGFHPLASHSDERR